MKRSNCAFLLLLCSAFVVAQTRSSSRVDLGRNAALRYWMAFAAMKDVPVDKQTADLIEHASEGTAPVSEERLGPILDHYAESLAIMHRGTHLPQCDWGIEYELGPATPIYHLAKARTMARINAIQAARLALKHETPEAVEAWLAGLRFGQDIAREASLIGALTAKTALVTDLISMRALVAAGHVDSTSAQKLTGAVQQLPQYGFDWTAALNTEAAVGEIALRTLKSAHDPAAQYREWFGQAPPANWQPPTPQEAKAFGDAMRQAAAAFALPDTQARPALAAIEARIRSMNAAVAMTMPSLTKALDARGEVERARQGFLNAVK